MPHITRRPACMWPSEGRVMGILEVKNVSKRFGGLQALGDVNLSIAENSVHALIGPNGAGKSTLLNVLVGKLIPDTGTVTFEGKSVLGREPHEINQMGISRVFQTPEIFGDLTRLREHHDPLLRPPRRLVPDARAGRCAQRARVDREGRADPHRREDDRQAQHARRRDEPGRQAPAGNGDVPGAGTPALAARRAHCRHGPRRYQQHDRAS